MSGLYGVDLRQGVTLPGPVTLLGITAANATAVFQISVFAQLVGAKSFILKRIWGINAAGGNTQLNVGTGVAGAYADLVPPILTLNGLNFDISFVDPILATATITAYTVLAGVTCQVEVIEVG